MDNTNNSDNFRPQRRSTPYKSRSDSSSSRTSSYSPRQDRDSSSRTPFRSNAESGNSSYRGSSSEGNSSYRGSSEGNSYQDRGSSSSYRSGGRSFSGGGRSFSGGRSFGRSSGGSGRFGGGRSGSGRGRKPNNIDPNKFINKATEIKEEAYIPQTKIEDLNIDNQLKANILKKGYTNLTSIQDKTIPLIIDGKDIIGIANTGVGKTAAFLIPLINKVYKDNNQKVIIITPTRELAQQIDKELFSLTNRLNIKSVICIGGAGIGAQLFKLSKPYNFLIGTPGRLKDLINRRSVRMTDFNNLVLDEVDRMFDMGFGKDIRYILDLIPKERQSLFFSATISREVEGLINAYSKSPTNINVKTRDTAASIDQDVIRVSDRSQKMEKLHELLIDPEFKKVLIFGKTKMGVDRLYRELRERGFKAETIHGDNSQYQRQRSLDAFKSGHVNILVATDVASRGLDIPDVTHVINYELPDTYEEYIHRIGRTGRANKTGKALTFI